MRLIVPVLSISVIVLLGCTSSPTNTTPPPTSTTTPVPTATTPPTTTAPAAAPTITFTSPGNNVHQIGDVTITVQVTDFTVVDKLGERNVVGEGHLHYFLDVPAPTEPRDPAVTGPGTYVATAASTIVWHNVTGGSHTVYAELVNNDHTPLIPPVVASQQFLVIPEIGPLQIVIATPRDGAMVGGGDVTITAQTSNFNLVDKLGQTDVQREGHIHYFIDADTPTTPGQPAVSAPGSYAATAATSYTWKNVTAGQHTFSVELVNNDHTPLAPPVVATVTIDVASSGPPVGGLVINSDSIITGTIVSINSSADAYPWQLDVMITSSQDVNNLPNPTKDKIGQTITCYTDENISALQVGQTINAHVKYTGDVPTPGIALYIYNITPVAAY